MSGPFLMEKDKAEVENATKRLQELAQKIQERAMQRKKEWTASNQTVSIDITKYATPTNRLTFDDALNSLFRNKVDISNDEFEMMMRDLNTIKSYLGSHNDITNKIENFNERINNASVVRNDTEFANDVSNALNEIAMSAKTKINLNPDVISEISNIRPVKIQAEFHYTEQVSTNTENEIIGQIRQEVDKKFNEVKDNVLTKGYTPSSEDLKSSVAQINLIDASLISQEKYIKALENLGLSKEDISDLTNRCIRPEYLKEKGIIVYPIRYLTKNPDGTALSLSTVPVLLREVTVKKVERSPNELGRLGVMAPVRENVTKIIAVNPMTGEALEDYVGENNKNEVANNLVKRLVDVSRFAPGVYGFRDGTFVEKKKEMTADDVLAAGAIVGGAALSATGVGASVGVGLIYIGSSYFALESASKLYTQIRTNTFDLASADTQLELGTMIVSFAPVARSGIGALSAATRMSGTLSYGLQIGLSGTEMAGMGVLYYGGTAKNAEVYGELVKEGKSPVMPIVTQSAMLAGTAVAGVAEYRMIDYFTSEMRVPSVNNSQLGKNTTKFLEKLNADPNIDKVYIYSFDKANTSTINNTTSKRFGDAVLLEYKKMFGRVRKEIEGMGYKTMANLQGGDELYFITTAPDDVFNQVYNKHFMGFEDAVRKSLRPIVKKGIISEQTVDDFLRVHWEGKNMLSVDNAYYIVKNEGINKLIGAAEQSSQKAEQLSTIIFGKSSVVNNRSLGSMKQSEAERYAAKMVKQGRKVYVVDVNDYVKSPELKKTFSGLSIENQGKGLLRVDKANKLDIIHYNLVGHDMGNYRIAITENSMPDGLLSSAEVVRVGPSTYIISSSQNVDISANFKQWLYNMNKNLNGISAELKITPVTTVEETRTVLGHVVDPAERAAMRVITYYNSSSTSRSDVMESAVKYLKNSGFNLEEIRSIKKIRMSDLPYFTNSEGKSVVDALKSYQGLGEISKVQPYGINPLHGLRLTNRSALMVEQTGAKRSSMLKTTKTYANPNR